MIIRNKDICICKIQATRQKINKPTNPRSKTKGPAECALALWIRRPPLRGDQGVLDKSRDHKSQIFAILKPSPTPPTATAPSVGLTKNWERWLFQAPKSQTFRFFIKLFSNQNFFKIRWPQKSAKIAKSRPQTAKMSIFMSFLGSFWHHFSSFF